MKTKEKYNVYLCTQFYHDDIDAGYTERIVGTTYARSEKEAIRNYKYRESIDMRNLAFDFNCVQFYKAKPATECIKWSGTWSGGIN